MQEKKDGSSYAPKGKANAVCAPGEFPVGVIGLDHGHILGMCNGLSEAGADIVLVTIPIRRKFPNSGRPSPRLKLRLPGKKC